MYQLGVWIGDHLMGITTSSFAVQEWLCQNYRVEGRHSSRQPDLQVAIASGYVAPFSRGEAEVTSDTDFVTYRRADCFIQVDHAYHQARVAVYDTFALNQALMSLYSAFVAAAC